MNEDIQQVPAELEPLDAAGAVSEDEQLVDTRSRGKMRKVLAVVFIILVLLLCGLTYLVVNNASPSGIFPGGNQGKLTWIRSIYGFGDSHSELTNPPSVAIDPANSSFWMTDPAFFRIVNYRLDGTLLGIIGKPVDEPGAFRQPSHIELDSEGNIYVVEVAYEVVRVFDKNGTELGEIEIPGVLSAAVSDDIMVFGAQAGFVIMDKDANIIKLVGEQGKEKDQFDRVNGVAIDEDDNIFVVDTFNNRISKYDEAGNRLWIVETGHPGNQTMTGDKQFEDSTSAQLQVPMGCTIDGNGNLVVMDMLGFQIAVFNSEDGGFIAKYGEPGAQDGQFMYPSDVDYDKRTDSFVIADNGMKRAQVIKLPDSGGNIGTSLMGLLRGPALLCLIPILLLIIALIIAYFMQRSRKNREAVKFQQYALEMQENSAADTLGETVPTRLELKE